jgi:hypothetical protein
MEGLAEHAADISGSEGPKGLPTLTGNLKRRLLQASDMRSLSLHRKIWRSQYVKGLKRG